VTLPLGALPPQEKIFLIHPTLELKSPGFLFSLHCFKGLVAFQQGEDSKSALDLFSGMMQKSLVGYAIAFGLGLLVYLLVLHILEKKVSRKVNEQPHWGWMIFQWCATGFLWSMWLVQDLANVFCYLPRELSGVGLVLSLGGMILLQGYMIRKRGGKIQNIVTAKTNTLDVRSATLIDFFYGIVLLFFKMDVLSIFPEKMPMSTTWVFLGLLAGRELGITLRLHHRSKKKVSKIIFSDAGKAFIGSVVSVLLALILPFLATMFTPVVEENQKIELSE